MADPQSTAAVGSIVEEEMLFTIEDLCRACSVSRTEVIVLVTEGVLEPGGSGPEDWLFAGQSLRRARIALRLLRDLELGAAGSAVVLDLLDEIEDLRARLRRAGLPYS